jgi:hypothetical protein
MSASGRAAGGAGGGGAHLSAEYEKMLAADAETIENTALVAILEYFCAKRYYPLIQGKSGRSAL